LTWLTRLRLGSALGLDARDVNVGASEIVVPHLKRNREERFFVPRPTMMLLRALVRGRAAGPIFLSAAGARLSTRKAQRRLRGWLEGARIATAVSPHSLRRMYAMRHGDGRSLRKDSAVDGRPRRPFHRCTAARIAPSTPIGIEDPLLPW
jgi:integrase